MGLIFIVAAVVAPRFSDFLPSLRVKKTTDRVFAWAQKARTDAATTGLRCRLVIDKENRKLWVDCEARPFRDPGKYTPLVGSTEEELPDEVSISLDGFKSDPQQSGLKVLEFRPDGTTSDARIVLSNDRGDQSAIKVVASTSRITLEATPQP